VDRAQLLREYAAADLLVNPHRTDLASSRHVFPSKLLEYLACGRPVLTTALPWMAAEYGHCCHVLDDESPEGVAAALAGLASIPVEERLDQARRARAWVLAEKSWDRQGERLGAFLRGLK
jgi:glycosyltransferase involved in cell wall biosynthesis